MNILFLTLVEFDSLNQRHIYTDLLREFANNGHKVFAISPIEKRKGIETNLIEEKNSIILRLKIGNIQKTNVIEKGISTITIESIFKRAIKRYFSNVKFDLIIFSTPPITLVGAIEYVKKRDGSKTYLLLKDIFPQNAVDIGLMSTKGLKGLLYNHFRNKEKKLYRLSDRIGCMSQANVDYVIQQNPFIDPNIVEVCPNSIEVVDKSVDYSNRNLIREKYGIPQDKIVFVYGGNLGKPQGIPFLIECLKKCSFVKDAFFLIVGDGTEYQLIDEFIRIDNPQNVKLMKRLPRDDYDTMVGSCDVGMIFLDHRFTIPNFPSRLLSYMQAKVPVLAVTDPNTDIGKVIVEGNFGWWCESNDSDLVVKKIETIVQNKTDLKDRGTNAWNYVSNHYSAKRSYEIITNDLITAHSD